jgi:hypothetical protein
MGPDRCNIEVCPIWNSDKLTSSIPEPVKAPEPPNDKSLREINLSLRNKAPADGFAQQCVAHGIKRRELSYPSGNKAT